MGEALLKRIRDAFPPGTPPPRPVTGHRCVECDEADQLLGGRTWAEVDADFPPSCHDVFPLLTPAAKAYYLPAYLGYAVRKPGMMAGLSVRSALEGGDLDPRAFTPAQRAAVWAWAEAAYRDEVGGPPDSVAEGWWLADAEAGETS